MKLVDKGLIPYQIGHQVRYFVQGMHGNFHLGNTDYVDADVRNIIKASGGLMRVLNHMSPSNNATSLFNTYGSKEVLLTPASQNLEHPFETWGHDYYHPHFEVFSADDMHFVVYFKNKESFLFLDDHIVFNHNQWLSTKPIETLKEILPKRAKNVSAIFSFNCMAGQYYHMSTEQILSSKINTITSL